METVGDALQEIVKRYEDPRDAIVVDTERTMSSDERWQQSNPQHGQSGYRYPEYTHNSTQSSPNGPPSESKLMLLCDGMKQEFHSISLGREGIIDNSERFLKNVYPQVYNLEMIMKHNLHRLQGIRDHNTIHYNITANDDPNSTDIDPEPQTYYDQRSPNSYDTDDTIDLYSESVSIKTEQPDDESSKEYLYDSDDTIDMNLEDEDDLTEDEEVMEPHIPNASEEIVNTLPRSISTSLGKRKAREEESEFFVDPNLRLLLDMFYDELMRNRRLVAKKYYEYHDPMGLVEDRRVIRPPSLPLYGTIVWPNGKSLALYDFTNGYLRCETCGGFNTEMVCKCGLVRYCSDGCAAFDRLFHAKNCGREAPIYLRHGAFENIPLNCRVENIKQSHFPSTLKEAEDVLFLDLVPRHKVFDIIIDSYRLYCWDAWTDKGDRYGPLRDKFDHYEHWKCYCAMLNRRDKFFLRPHWWSGKDHQMLVRYGTNRANSGWWYVYHGVKLIEIMKMYKGAFMHMAMRALYRRVWDARVLIIEDGEWVELR